MPSRTRNSLAFVGLIAFLGISSAGKADPYAIKGGNTVYANRDELLTCNSSDDVYKFINMSKQKDTRGRTAMLLHGTCRVRRNPGALHVEQTKLDNACVRSRGGRGCVWTNRGWLTKNRAG
jgi:hypothetical protein